VISSNPPPQTGGVISDLAGLVFESAPQPAQSHGGISGYDLFGNNSGDNFGGGTQGATALGDDDKSKNNGKKTTQDILSLYGSSTTTTAFNGNLGGPNMGNSPYAAGTGVNPSYQWNQVNNSQSTFSPFSSTPGSTGHMAPQYQQSSMSSTNAFNVPNNNSAFIQNNISNQFGNMNLGGSNSMPAQMQPLQGFNMSSNAGSNFMTMNNGNPFASSTAQPGPPIVGPGNMQLTPGSNPYGQQQINWQQAPTSSYSFNNFSTSQNSNNFNTSQNGIAMYSGNINTTQSAGSTTFGTMHQQSQFAPQQNFSQFQNPFASTNQQQTTTPQMSNNMFTSAGAQVSGYGNMQTQPQSLWG